MGLTFPWLRGALNPGNCIREVNILYFVLFCDPRPEVMLAGYTSENYINYVTFFEFGLRLLSYALFPQWKIMPKCILTFLVLQITFISLLAIYQQEQ